MKSTAARVNPATTNLFDLDRSGMIAFATELGEKPFRCEQLLKWIHQHQVTDFESMTNLSKPLRARLTTLCHTTLPHIVAAQRSADGTRKWLLELDCGNRIETVFIPETERGTLCVSSQAGCALNCSFCSTAQQGFSRNLTVAEIIGQVWLTKRELGASAKITNVVMMGMGEPLLNFDNVVRAMNLMIDDFAYGLAKQRVTLSTSGVVPEIDRLRETSGVSLAVSLHAVDDKLRDQLVPINRKYPLAQLLAACGRYVAGEKRRKVTFEYVMLDKINDSPAEAKTLCKMLAHIPSKINLIPFNPFPNSGYRGSPQRVLDRFREILQSHGIVTTLRKTRGDDIDAACGQLVGRVQPRKPNWVNA